MYPSAIFHQLGSGVTIAILTLLLTLLLIKSWMENRCLLPLPPGPALNRFPIFGYLPFLGGNRPVHDIFVDFAKKYGRIFHVRLGNKMMVVISCPQLLKEVYKREDITDRPHSPLVDGVMDGYGISSAEGPLWKNQRQFVVAKLRHLGMMRSNVANSKRHRENMTRAVEQLLEKIDQTKGQPFDIRLPLSFSVANIFTSTVISKTFDFNDPELLREVVELDDSFEIIENVTIANFLPIFCYWPTFRRILKTIRRRREATRNFYRKIIAEHRIDLDPENPRDFIDAYLIKMDKDKEEGKQTYFQDVQLLSILGDMFSAGTETIKITLLWAFVALLRHPDVQQKVQKELDDLIGHFRPPYIEDLPHLPYFQAFIQEVLRMSSILSVGNPHCPSRDVTIEGYRIPKGSLVVGLIWKIHHDPETWENPCVFNPNNFLSNDGHVVNRDDLLPFSTGRRKCLGEDIARHEIFIVLANILQRFTLLPSDDEELPSLLVTGPGILRMPLPYKIRAVPRQ